MPLHNPFATFAAIFVFINCYVAHSLAYFVVKSPGEGTVWREGVANPITWSKGVADGINFFDIEINRLGQDGLLFVARNVPATSTSLNVFLQDVPSADDYFVVFVNATHGVLHTTSKKFSITSSSATPPKGASLSSPDPNAPTVTVSGSPNPTQAFSTTFAALDNSSLRPIFFAHQAWSFGGVLLGCLFGTIWTLW